MSAPGKVTVEGVPGVLTSSGMVTAAVGAHTVTAAPVTVPQAGITSQVFAASVAEQTACVRAGETTTVNVSLPKDGKF